MPVPHKGGYKIHWALVVVYRNGGKCAIGIFLVRGKISSEAAPEQVIGVGVPSPAQLLYFPNAFGIEQGQPKGMATVGY